MSICKKALCFLEAFFGPARYSNSTAGCIKKRVKKCTLADKKAREFVRLVYIIRAKSYFSTIKNFTER
jgi:hypothetical protein